MAAIKLSSSNLVEVQDVLYQFVKDEVLNGTSWTADAAFEIIGDLFEEFDQTNQALLLKRVNYQKQIDSYYQEKRKTGWKPTPESAIPDAQELEAYLKNIGYLGDERPIDFEMDTPQLDPEMDQHGPELVTPVSNASMAVGGANARWGSLYDAYFLSDITNKRFSMILFFTNFFIINYLFCMII